MVDFIKDNKEFEKYRLRFMALFREGIAFEQNPFNLYFKHYLAFEFDFIYHELFFEGIKSFLSKIENISLTFYTIEPSPKEYFFKHFQKYSVFEIGVDKSDEELSNIMMKDPGNSPADAFAINSNYIAIFSSSDQWAISGSRDWEIAIVGFTSKEIKDLFISSFGENSDMFFTVRKQVEIYDEMFSFSKKQRKKYDKLIESYRDEVHSA